MRILLCFLLLATASRARAAPLPWSAAQGDFVFCLLRAHDGFWVGTEENGLWQRDAGGQWRNFKSADGLGDESVRCLLERGDQIWAGTARGGLSIYDGFNWHRVGVDEGLPSQRINDLALDAGTGDVWIATDGGLCRWNGDSPLQTMDSPLARHQIVAVACARGLVWAATACDGLLKSSDQGATWTAIHGARTQPTTATGAGLPSDILNDVAVDELGQIWVATDYGLAKSSDEGAKWFFLRGADWRDNVAGSAAGLKPSGDEAGVEAPGEDWVQCVVPDGQGHVWLGFRQQGAEMRDIQTNELIYATRLNAGRATAPGDIWVRAIAPSGQEPAILGRYGGGLDAVLGADLPAPLTTPTVANALKVTNFPGRFPIWDAAEIARRGTMETTDAGKAALWDMDYRTRGDWVGRYGDSLASVYETPWERTFRRDKAVEVETGAGGPVAPGASPIYGNVAYMSSNNLDVLYNPAIGTRRMAEINDGTWQHDVYPFSHEGPGLLFFVTVPPGAHRVALYFYNSDGHGGNTRYRDYIVSIKTPDQAADAPDLARCRASDFWGGVYASFAVSGPGRYSIVIERHRSEATKISGVFVDRIGSQIAAPLAMPSMRGVQYYTQPAPVIKGENATVTAARALWQQLDSDAAQGTLAPDGWEARHQLLRAVQAAGADEALLFNWRWKLGIWTREDRETFGDAMAQIENKRVATGVTN